MLFFKKRPIFRRGQDNFALESFSFTLIFSNGFSIATSMK